MPSPFDPRGATREDRVWTRSRYDLPERFALAPLGTFDARTEDPGALRRAADAAGLRDPVIATGDGTETMPWRHGVIGLGRVDDRELRALYGECSAVIVRARPGPFGVTLPEARRSGRPVMAWDGASLVDPGPAPGDAPDDAVARMAEILERAAAGVLVP
jgi:hypothetical protein